MRENSVCSVLCALSVVAALIVSTLAGSVTILDEHDPIDVESIAATMCNDVQGYERQISRLSTVDKLANYFEEVVVSAAHKFADCKRRHQDAVTLLNEVLTTSNENVCSEAKLNLIEDFHNLYVSTHLNHEQSRKENQRDMAPQLLRLFFMHYAMELDALCKRTLINNLDWDLKEKFGDEIERRLFELDQEEGKDRSGFGALFKGAMQKFTDLYSVEKYEDVLMIWDLIENSYLNQKMALAGEDIRDEFDPVTGEPVRLLVRIRSRGYLDEIKEHCYYNFKPIYRKLILPIIKLADLGYSNNGEQFKVELDELRSNERVRRWYSVTQLCEAMLPIKFYEDPSLELNDVVVISKKEAAQLESGQNASGEGSARRPLEYEPVTNSFVGRDNLESVASEEAQKLVNSIKSNLSARDRVMGRTVVRLLRNIKSQLKSTKIGRFFFSKDTEKLTHPKSNEKEAHFAREEVGQQLKQSLDQLDDLELLKMEGAAQTTRAIKSKKNAQGIGRRRRYRRKGDVDEINNMRTEALSYTRTKTWSEIFAGWGEILAAITPTRTQMIIVGGFLIGMLFLIVWAIVFSMATAAG